MLYVHHYKFAFNEEIVLSHCKFFNKKGVNYLQIMTTFTNSHSYCVAGKILVYSQWLATIVAHIHTHQRSNQLIYAPYKFLLYAEVDVPVTHCTMLQVYI